MLFKAIGWKITFYTTDKTDGSVPAADILDLCCHGNKNKYGVKGYGL